MALGCCKRGRRTGRWLRGLGLGLGLGLGFANPNPTLTRLTGRWRRVRLSLAETGLAYTRKLVTRYRTRTRTCRRRGAR